MPFFYPYRPNSSTISEDLPMLGSSAVATWAMERNYMGPGAYAIECQESNKMVTRGVDPQVLKGVDILSALLRRLA